MARERPILSGDSTPASGEGNGTETSAIGRRSYLKLFGATAAAGGALASAGRAAADSHDLDLVEIDYDECYDPSSRYNGLDDAYRVWNHRSGTDPDITSNVSRSGETCCAHHLDGNQMTANTVYPLDDHYGDEVDELYQRFYVHPNGMWLSENNTMRIFWIGLRNGPESSGAGWSAPHTGADGWSVRAGFTRRRDHDHPNTYTFFVYSYDMRLNSSTTPYIEYGNDVQVPMDEWTKVETYQKLNSYDSSGANSDGELRVWVNDELAYARDGFAWRSTRGQGIQEAGPYGYDLYQDNDPHTIFFDDHVLLVNGTRDDWQSYEDGTDGGGSSDGSSDESSEEDTNNDENSDGDEGADDGYENELAILTEPGADRVGYRFVVDGPVETADLGTSPSGNPTAANGNDSITELDDGRYAVEGLTGNGWGDGFGIDGSVVEFEAENADADADPEFWLELNGEEVSVDELVDDGEDGEEDDAEEAEPAEFAVLTEPGADRVGYRFVVDGPVETADLGTSPSGNPMAANGNDSITELDDGRYAVEGLTGNGWGDGFVVDGAILEFEAENADADADPEFWLELNGEEVSVDELIDDEEPEPEEEVGGEFAVLTEPGADRVGYRFVVDGPVETADLGTSPSGNPMAANGNDSITELDDGRYAVEGLTGNGWGDGFVVDGAILEFEAENADADADPEFWLELNGEEVSVDELID